jgi:hypothetical protein
MKSVRSFVLCLSLGAAVFSVGCAADSSEPASNEEEVRTSSNAALRRDLIKALDGLETLDGSNEGGPTPYKVVDLALAQGETLDAALVAAKVLPKMEGFDAPRDGFEAGADESDIADFWKEATSVLPVEELGSPDDLPAEQARAEKWKGVKKLVDERLKDTKYFHVGHRRGTSGSLESGTVALAVAGVSKATGRLFVFYALTVWT